MTTTAFLIPPVNLMGAGCLGDAAKAIHSCGFRKALVVTAPSLVRLGIVKKVCDLLAAHGVEAVVFDDLQPNPMAQNVTDGLSLLRDNACDFVISLGGGSPHDCAKGIALVAVNGRTIKDDEGLDPSGKPQLADDAPADLCLAAIYRLSGDISFPSRLTQFPDQVKNYPGSPTDAIEDGTRPLVSQEEIRAIFSAAM